MKSDVDQFLALRTALVQERAQIQTRLAAIDRALGATATPAPVAVAPAAVTPVGKRTFSAATKAKMRVAQQARWAKLKPKSGAAPAPAAAPAPKQKKRAMSAQGRANIIAAVKARWAKAKALKAKSAAK